MMLIGILSIDVFIPDSNSLKDKRSIIKGLLSSIRQKFNVSASEVDALDKLRRSVLGIACVSNDRTIVESMLNKSLQLIESDPRVEVTYSQIEIL